MDDLIRDVVMKPDGKKEPIHFDKPTLLRNWIVDNHIPDDYLVSTAGGVVTVRNYLRSFL